MANVFMKEFPVIVLKKRVIIVISLCVTMILLFLQPFSFGFYHHYAIFPALGYGGVTFISMHVFNSLIKKLSLKWISHWIVLYEIGFIFALLLFIATLNFLFTVYIGAITLNGDAYLSWLKITLCVGLFPTFTAIMYVQFKSKIDKYDIEAKPKAEQRMITIKDMVGNSKLTISSNDFVYAEIRCSTLYIYFMHDELLREKHLRATISSIENNVCDESIVRCHRSFIINIKYIDAIEGNSNGYKLYLKCCNAVIPVSRQYTLKMKNLLDEYTISI